MFSSWPKPTFRKREDMKIYSPLFTGLMLLSLVSCSTRAKKITDEKEVVEVKKEQVQIRILAFNDFHGNLEGPSGSVMVEGKRVKAGGADFLAAKIKERRTENTMVVSAGDLIGASPLISAVFHDEPTIEAANLMGLELNAVGNHEFDEGVDELKRMQKGGCHPTDGCQDGDGFSGATFKFLAANVFEKSNGETIFASTAIKKFGDISVGIVGLTLEGTPSVVSSEGIQSVRFGDEVEAINKAVSEFQAQGIETIVVLVHEGGFPTSDQADRNQCPGISGPILEIAKNSSDAVDVFITGHTHKAYICEMDGKLVTAAKSYGRLLTEIDLVIDPITGDVLSREANNIVIDRQGIGQENVKQVISKYRAIVSPIANKPIGKIASDFKRDYDENGISPLGRLIADVQLEGTQSAGAQIAFMNPGGIRAPLNFIASGVEGEGVVTYSEAHTSQPFGNSLVTMTLTGAQLKLLLEAQFRDKKITILQPSSGFIYTWSQSAPFGTKVDPASMKLGGITIERMKEYRITVNSFLADGGDGFKLLKHGTKRVGGPIDVEALVNYFSIHSPVKVSTDVRVLKKK